MKKDYSLMAHALHSRLQLVRQQLHAKPGMEPSELVSLNRGLFDKAALSVRIYHHCQCVDSDYLGAAELLLMTAGAESPSPRANWTVHKNEFYFVEMRDSTDQWSAITQELAKSFKGAFSPRMSYQDALVFYRYLCKRSSASNFRISKFDPSTDG
nr:hypothetical protein [uncultured Dyadobacter sp.]